jgi:microcystin-dependent protein
LRRQAGPSATGRRCPFRKTTFIASNAAASSNDPGGQVIAQSGQRAVYTEDTTTTNLAPTAVVPIGGSQPHENLQPYLAISFIISLFGVFPSQS